MENEIKAIKMKCNNLERISKVSICTKCCSTQFPAHSEMDNGKENSLYENSHPLKISCRSSKVYLLFVFFI